MKRVKRIIGLLAMAAFIVSPSLAFASEQIGVYVTPKFVYGYTQMQKMKTINNVGETIAKGNKSDDAFGGALALGYDVNKKFQLPLRTELEYAAFSRVSGKIWWGDSGAFFKQRLNIQTLLVNAYYDFRNTTAFTPYLGFGLGVAFIEDKGSRYHPVLERHRYGAKTNTNFAWNVGAGLAYDFTNRFSLDMNYRFAGLGEGKTEKSIVSQHLKTKNIYMHQLAMGVRITF